MAGTRLIALHGRSHCHQLNCCSRGLYHIDQCLTGSRSQSVHAGGPSGSSAKCANVNAGGAISFQGAAGSFKDMLSLAFSIRKPAGGTPNVKVNIGADQVFRQLCVTWT